MTPRERMMRRGAAIENAMMAREAAALRARHATESQASDKAKLESTETELMKVKRELRAVKRELREAKREIREAKAARLSAGART